MSVLDPELADALHASGRSGSSSSRPGSFASLTAAGGSIFDLLGSGSPADGSRSHVQSSGRPGGSSGDQLSAEQPIGASLDGGSQAGAYCAFSSAAADPFVATADLLAGSSSGGSEAAGGGEAASGAAADSGARSQQSVSPDAADIAHSPAAQLVGLRVDEMQNSRQPEAPQPEHRLSRCLSHDSDVEEDRQRLAGAQRWAPPPHSEVAQPGAAGASAIDVKDVDGAGTSSTTSNCGACGGGGVAASPGQRSAPAPSWLQQDGGHFEVAAPLPSDAEPLQHPLQQAFRAAQALLQPPRQVRGPLIRFCGCQ